MTNDLEHMEHLDSERKLREVCREFANAIERPRFTWHSTSATDDGHTVQVMFEDEQGRTIICTAPLDGSPAVLCWAD